MTYSCVPALAIHLLERVSPASSLAAAARNWAAGCSLVWPIWLASRALSGRHRPGGCLACEITSLLAQPFDELSDTFLSSGRSEFDDPVRVARHGRAFYPAHRSLTLYLRQ